MTAHTPEPLQLVDAHVHLWDLSAHSWYPAMQDPEIARSWAGLGDISRMSRDFLYDTFRAETSPAQITALVHVSATTAPRAYLAEARWVDGVLDAAGVPAVTVGTVDPALTAAEIESDLEAQAAAARFRGIRVLSGLDPDSAAAEWICAWLAERGFSFDLVAHPGQAAAFARLLERHPDLDVALEHAGWPDGTGPAEQAAWRAALRTLADNPRVSCKVSGLGMVTHTLAADVLRPFIEGCLEVFGPRRCLFGGNFPVDAMYGSYGELLTAVGLAAESLSPDERRDLWSANARRVYRI